MQSHRRRSLPPLKSLHVFEVAARHQSFSQAALELNVSASAVSHQIQLLERRLGIVLFERHGGGVILTKAATRYAAELGSALDQIAAATEKFAPQKIGDDLELLSGHAFAARWLQPNLGAFQKLFPTARIRVQTFSRLEELPDRKFDVAICYGFPAFDKWHVEPLVTETIMPLCSPALATGHPLRGLEDLLKVTLIHSDNSLSWQTYLSRFGITLPDDHAGMWLDRSTLALEAAADSQGVVLESGFLARRELQNGTLITPFGSSGGIDQTSYFLACRNGFKAKPVARRFRDWIVHSLHPNK